MTSHDQLTRAVRGRPATVTTAAALVAVATLGELVQPALLWSLYGRLPLADTVPLVVSLLVPVVAYAVVVPGLLRGAGWARVAFTALAAVAVGRGLPTVLVRSVADPDVVLLAYLAAQAVLVGALVLLWTPTSRAWFGPVR